MRRPDFDDDCGAVGMNSKMDTQLRGIEMTKNQTQQAADDEKKWQAALVHIAAVRVHWQGKPIPDRDVLYDEARG